MYGIYRFTHQFLICSKHKQAYLINQSIKNLSNANSDNYSSSLATPTPPKISHRPPFHIFSKSFPGNLWHLKFNLNLDSVLFCGYFCIIFKPFLEIMLKSGTRDRSKTWQSHKPRITPSILHLRPIFQAPNMHLL